jgi:magnesium transporter
MAYISELLGCEIRDHRGNILGKLTDLVTLPDQKNGYPHVVALALSCSGNHERRLIPWTGNEDLAGNRIVLQQPTIQLYQPSGSEIYLARDVLDQQVIDIENHRVARVYDLELGRIGNAYSLINIDVGVRGRLRRLGLEDLAERLAERFHRPLPTRAAAWGDVNLLPEGGLQVKVARQKLKELHPADIAEILENVGPHVGGQMLAHMEDEKIADTLEELEPDLQAEVLESFPDERAADIVEEMEPDAAADLFQEFNDERRAQVFNLMQPEERAEVAELLEHPEDTAGGLMTTKYVSVPPGITTAEALQEVKRSAATREAELIYYIYVLDGEEHLLGVVSLGDLVLTDPDGSIDAIMHHKPIRVLVDASPEEVREAIHHYNLLAVPVVDAENRLQGIITADHAVEIIQRENTEDMLRIAGSDAEEMERRSPFQIAVLRLPWIMATMFIELGAGVVIHLYDATLARVLLLASFMPIISAISGNTGLQSATIVVRGLATGQLQMTKWQQALRRQLTMTLLLGAATGLTLGTIGAIWYGKWTFGLVVAIGMFAAVNVAGMVGTVVPLISKNLGLDPAITAGPFETAFQDVVGISIFLTLATLLMRYLL